MAEPILTVTNLHKRFGAIKVLRGVDLALDPREVVCLIGRSGSGKSTLLRCINFLDEADEGEIAVAGFRVPAGEKSREHRRQILMLRQRVGMVFQQFNLFMHMTVLENLIEAPIQVRKLERELAVAVAEDLLQRLGLYDKRDVYPSRLSSGQQQRVAIARALAMEPIVLLFDEPTSALDPELTGEVLQTMRYLAREGTTMIVVTHEMGFARDVADRVIYIDQGVFVEQGPPAQLLGQPKDERLKLFLDHVID